MKLFLCVCFILAGLLCVVYAQLDDPYRILGVSKTATATEIKRAYKKLAKLWHPDKNDDSSAQEKFIEINEAYQLLSDPERRRDYDNFGYTTEQPQRRGGGGHPFGFDPFESFFQFRGGNGFHFKFSNGRSGSTVFSEHRINYWTYENQILPKSQQKPYALFIYGDWCMLCMQAEPLWERLTKDLEAIGFGYAAINAHQDGALAKAVRAHHIPEIVAVVNGRVFHQKDGVQKFSTIVNFLRNSLPYESVTFLRKQSYFKPFVDSSEENKIRVVFFGKSDKPKLRYLTVAFAYRDYAKFMYALIGHPEIEDIQSKYGIDSSRETVLIFKENPDVPAASLSMQDISANSLRELVESNKFLVLPRLSSQMHFDLLCPVEPVRQRKQLCVVLVTSSSLRDKVHRDALREYINRQTIATDRVHFAYIYRDTQQAFVKSLVKDRDNINDSVLDVAILWRPSEDKIKYEWVESGWSADPAYDSQRQLEGAVKSLLKGTEELSRETLLMQLIDENAKGNIGKIIDRMMALHDYILWDITQEEALPVISAVLSIAFIITAGYFIAYLVKMEEDSISEKRASQEQYRKRRALETAPRSVPLYELHGGTYDGLVRLLKPGCRTLVIMIDESCKQKLLEKFASVVYPYRGNKSLAFAFLHLEKHVKWYRRLLLLTLGALSQNRELNINPKNCVGTVLALNGHRKYYCIYHAKHPGIKKTKAKWKSETTKQTDLEAVTAKFIGFDETSSEESSDYEGIPGEKLFVDDLTAGLPNWLDRLFEGSVQRYPLDYWPKME